MDGKTATGDGFAVTSHSLDSTAQMLELAYTTNGTPQIAAIAGEFLSAQIVGEEAAETPSDGDLGNHTDRGAPEYGIAPQRVCHAVFGRRRVRTVYDLDLPVGGGD